MVTFVNFKVPKDYYDALGVGNGIYSLYGIKIITFMESPCKPHIHYKCVLVHVKVCESFYSVFNAVYCLEAKTSLYLYFRH